jgi:protein ECT2
MDPVQRIPRYTLLFRTMVKFMGPSDPRRAKLLEADEMASKIAQAETDEQTKRGAAMYRLATAVHHFPPALISNSRRFLDCIDCEDIIAPHSGSGDFSTTGLERQGPTGPGTLLSCSLFLFDDKLMVVKRPSGEKSGRALAGLDDLEKVTRTPGASMKKTGLVCKGVIEITDVVATDVGGSGKG